MWIKALLKSIEAEEESPLPPTHATTSGPDRKGGGGRGSTRDDEWANRRKTNRNSKKIP